MGIGAGQSSPLAYAGGIGVIVFFGILMVPIVTSRGVKQS
jgi:hypothetical protein